MSDNKEFESFRIAILAEIEQLYAEINNLKDEIKEVKKFKLDFINAKKSNKSL